MLSYRIAKAYCSGGDGANSIWLVVVRIRLVQDLESLPELMNEWKNH